MLWDKRSGKAEPNFHHAAFYASGRVNNLFQFRTQLQAVAHVIASGILEDFLPTQEAIRKQRGPVTSLR